MKKFSLFPFALLIWGPLWFLLPSRPTLEPVVKLLLDTPENFTAFWNTCLQTLPQLAGQLAVGAVPAAIYGARGCARSTWR